MPSLFFSRNIEWKRRGRSTGRGTSSQKITTQLEVVVDFLRATLSSMDGVLEPALVDGAFFAAFNSLNTQIAAVFSAEETRSISASAVAALAEGLEVVREFAEESEIDSLPMLLDTTQQLVALVAQATVRRPLRPF
jgi:hypothetical protein